MKVGIVADSVEGKIGVDAHKIHFGGVGGGGFKRVLNPLAQTRHIIAARIFVDFTVGDKPIPDIARIDRFVGGFYRILAVARGQKFAVADFYDVRKAARLRIALPTVFNPAPVGGVGGSAFEGFLCRLPIRDVKRESFAVGEGVIAVEVIADRQQAFGGANNLFGFAQGAFLGYDRSEFFGHARSQITGGEKLLCVGFGVGRQNEKQPQTRRSNRQYRQ